MEDALVRAVRNAAAEFGCRLEICSDVRLPVSASTPDRKAYGFGTTIKEAVTKLEAKLKAKAEEDAEAKKEAEYRNKP